MTRRRSISRTLATAAVLAAALAGCGSADDESAVAIAWIGTADAPFDTGLRLSPPAQAIRAATAEGLVSLNETGEVVPALAERWIVTDDGLSYIFRLRNSDWPAGEGGAPEPIDADEVRDSLRRTLRELRGTSLGLDFAAVTDVRAMTGRVIEIRLASPVPDFLQLLAQPELGLFHKKRGAGPLTLTRTGDVARLALLPPEARGLPTREDWREGTRPLVLKAMDARAAVAAFRSGAVDIVLGGTLPDFPLADSGPLSRGNVRLDAAQGLMGLKVMRAEGLLEDAGRREALSMAIERDTLIAPFNIAGWEPSTRIAPSAIAAGAPERWAGQTIEQRRAVARQRIAGYGGERRVTVSLPDGPGSDLLLRELAADWAEIGVAAVRARPGETADLALVDAVARFGSRRWYLDQFACAVRRALCSPEADALVRESAAVADPVARETMLAEAEARLTAQGTYIPLGAPVRWSMVRGTIAGFAENRWAVHPLPPLAAGPT
ncbi:ABC transporter substrate-binding protein [Tsuneonella amylolytica]|uniref:ABC transporter substrate-binding protein n=1 Tax=Tsuneonella amylolytica TaxID=2338327 RepID=UPI000EA8E7D4|nr:ABC transporter substrate-binding protein [Tsuneonella amylolytica]